VVRSKLGVVPVFLIDGIGCLSPRFLFQNPMPNLLRDTCDNKFEKLKIRWSLMLANQYH